MNLDGTGTQPKFRLRLEPVLCVSAERIQRGKVLGKKLVYSERYTFQRQDVGHPLRRQEALEDTHSINRGPEIWGG